MDRRRLWTYKGKTLKEYQQKYIWLSEENEKLNQERDMFKKQVQCIENAELLAATALLELRTKEKVKPLAKTIMVPCGGCVECKGNLECYTLKIEKR